MKMLSFKGKFENIGRNGEKNRRRRIRKAVIFTVTSLITIIAILCSIIIILFVHFWLRYSQWTDHIKEARKAWNKGEFEVSLKKIEDAEKLIKDYKLPSEYHKMVTLHDKGRLYYLWGDYKKAKSYLENALFLFENIGDQESKSPKFLDASINIKSILALIEDNLGRHLKAQKLLLDCLSLLESEQHPEARALRISVFMNLGSVYMSMGRYKEALEFLKKAERILRNDDATASVLYNNFGECYAGLGQIELARENFEKALAIHDRISNPLDTAGLGAVYNNLGTLYFTKIGDMERAESYFEKGLKIREQFWGHNHPETLKSFHNIGLFYSATGKLEKAIAHLSKAVEISTSIFGEEHSETALSQAALGVALLNLNKLEEAKEHFTIALNIYNSQENHKKEISVLIDISEVSNRLGKYGEAKAALMRVESLLDEIKSSDPEQYTEKELAIVFFEFFLQSAKTAMHLGERAAALEFFKVAKSALPDLESIELNSYIDKQKVARIKSEVATIEAQLKSVSFENSSWTGSSG